MKYTQSSLPYISLLVALLILAVFDAVHDVHSDSSINVNLTVSDIHTLPGYEEITIDQAGLLTQNGVKP